MRPKYTPYHLILNNYALPLFSVMMLLDLMHAAESESALETQDYRN